MMMLYVGAFAIVSGWTYMGLCELADEVYPAVMLPILAGATPAWMFLALLTYMAGGN